MGCASRAGPKHDIMGPIHNTACIIRGLGRHDTKAQVVPGSAFRHDTNNIGPCQARHKSSMARWPSCGEGEEEDGRTGDRGGRADTAAAGRGRW